MISRMGSAYIRCGQNACTCTVISSFSLFRIGTAYVEFPPELITSRLICPRSSFSFELPPSATEPTWACRQVCAAESNTAENESCTSLLPGMSTVCTPISTQPPNVAPQSLLDSTTSTPFASATPVFSTVTVISVTSPATGMLGDATMAPYP
eukprot:3936109-Rhodomonas_salina.3